MLINDISGTLIGTSVSHKTAKSVIRFFHNGIVLIPKGTSVLDPQIHSGARDLSFPQVFPRGKLFFHRFFVFLAPLLLTNVSFLSGFQHG